MGQSRQSFGRQARLGGVLAAAGALAVCLPAVAHEIAGAQYAHEKRVEVPAGELHEECMDLTAGQRLAYSYAAPRTVAFNIDYHVGDKFGYAVRKHARHVHGTFTPQKARGYCMMWTNPHKATIELSYSYTVSAARK